MNTPPISRHTAVSIDTAALAHNLRQVRLRLNAQHRPYSDDLNGIDSDDDRNGIDGASDHCHANGNSKILAMVKADAYGHGVAHCLPALQQADGAGVASFEEGKQIRLLGWDKPIVMIEGAFSASEWQQAVSFELSCVIHHQVQLEWALAHRPDFAAYPEHPSRSIWLKLNTGMNRLGYCADSIVAAARALCQAGYRLILTSHFANADMPAHPLNHEQIRVFNQVLQKLRTQISPQIAASLCNSAGLIHYPNYHYDWVRPGIMLYGSSPSAVMTASQLNLRPVMSLTAALMAIDELPAGACVGYGSSYTAKRPIKKGIISIGYGDGYPRVVSDSAWVSLYQDGQYYRCPILGRVAMDMIAIDLSAVPEPTLGSPVILWGQAQVVSERYNPSTHLKAGLSTDLTAHPTGHITTDSNSLSDSDASTNRQHHAEHKILSSIDSKDIDNKALDNISFDNKTCDNNALVPSVDDVATWAGTIGYELLCRLSQRPKRHLI